MTDLYFGFDSAWTDKPSAPGAICAFEMAKDECVAFHAPRLVRFSEALAFIRSLISEDGVTLIALDQPTIVPNATSMRPVERAVASLVSWLGGGVQPSNRGKTGMFCDQSPIWTFLSDLKAEEAPEACRSASHGLYLIEVFPALALPSLGPEFFGRLAAPRYNPDRRRTFRLSDWRKVASVVAASFAELGLPEPAAWCASQGELQEPKKADQDRLDAMICALVGMRWRLRPRTESILLGCLENGYMVAPGSPGVRERLTLSCARLGVPLS